MALLLTSRMYKVDFDLLEQVNRGQAELVCNGFQHGQRAKDALMMVEIKFHLVCNLLPRNEMLLLLTRREQYVKCGFTVLHTL